MNRQTAAQPATKLVPGGVLQRKCACGQHAAKGECEGCRKKKGALQRSPAGAAPALAPRTVHEVLSAPGQPLRAPWQGFMESRFGHDFSGVRLHTDPRAAESARQVGAHAYTVGRHVVFGEGRFQPESPAGRHLLAHELVHVMQQERAGSGAPIPARASLEVGPPQDSFEREAETLASAAVALSRPRAVPARLVQRQPAGAQPQKKEEPPPAEKLTLEMRRQIAAQLREAMGGLGTDEESIYAALSGRAPGQIEEIRQTYEEMYKGRRLADDLRGELNDKELQHLAALAPTAVPPAAAPKAKEGKDAVELPPGQRADAVAAELKAAVDYWLGTDEEAIFSALTGRPKTELDDIKAAYKRLADHELEADLKSELSGAELRRALLLLEKGFLEPEEQIWVATEGLGTNETLLFAALEGITGDPVKVNQVIDAYRDKGYGDMLEDVRSDLSGRDLDRAMELLHGATTSSASCSPDERNQGLEAISKAASMARNASSQLDTAVAAGKLSGKVKDALEENFNPGGAQSGVTVAHARQVSAVLGTVRAELLSRNQVTCSTPNPMPCGTSDSCVQEPNCSPPDTPGQVRTFTIAWTCGTPGTVVRLCKVFFVCDIDKNTSMLHEFVHHGGIDDKAYKKSSGFGIALQPLGNRSKLDSLDNADSYANLAKDLS